MSRHFFSWGVVVLTMGAGCAQFQEVKQDMLSTSRNRHLAKVAWQSVADQFAGQPYVEHFERGFLEGYFDVAQGGDGCVPAFPPRRYWSVYYQSPQGQQMILAWFAGYAEGARVAEQDGVRNFTMIPTSIRDPRENAPIPAVVEPGAAPLPVPAGDTFGQRGYLRRTGVKNSSRTGLSPAASSVPTVARRDSVPATLAPASVTEDASRATRPMLDGRAVSAPAVLAAGRLASPAVRPTVDETPPLQVPQRSPLMVPNPASTYRRVESTPVDARPMVIPPPPAINGKKGLVRRQALPFAAAQPVMEEAAPAGTTATTDSKQGDLVR